MELVLRGLQWIILLIYPDDVIVTGRSFEEHIMRLFEVLQRFLDYGLKFKQDKCKLMQTNVPFLGHIVSEYGVEPNLERPRCEELANTNFLERAIFSRINKLLSEVP